MIRTTDGSGQFKRIAGVGQMIPVLGVSPTVITYVATGGETSINLSSQTPSISYKPGQHQLKVKRSSGGGELFAGVDYTETSPTTIGFAAGDALIAGEIVEIELKFAATGVMAVTPRPDCYTAVGTVGQTLVTADFSWTYNAFPSKSVGAVRVYLHGVLQTRGVDYTEVNLGTALTNQITFVDALLGGENITILPTQQVIDDAGASTQFNNSRITGMQSMLAAGAQSFVDQSSDMIAVPNTTIVGRAKIPNLANDLRASLGVERIPTQALVQLQNEFGPNGEPVYSVVNDDRGLIRCVGSCSNYNGSWGQGIGNPSGVGNYFEIVFYGTGLNLLRSYASSSIDWRVTVDGGSEGSNIFSDESTTLSARNYSSNTIQSIVSGLSLGIHTVRLRKYSSENTMLFYGFEILNANASGYINLNTGTAYINGSKVIKSAASSVAYNTGVTGTKGGRVVRYLNSDGTVGEAFTPTGAAAAYLSNADHTNEEVVRTNHFREFGAGRSDDFSLPTSTTTGSGTTPKAFTLDDGTTTLVAGGANASFYTAPGGLENIYCNAVNDFITFTFVGTGVDIFSALTTSCDTHSVYIDGTSIGTLSATAFGRNKIASGLPYGTHTLKIMRTAVVSNTLTIVNFIVYQPKKPTIPSSAVELCDYNVMADFAANTTASLETIATGVLRKASVRELIYVNGTGGTTDWAVSNSAGISSHINGWQLATDRQNAYVEYLFFGTGCEIRFNSASDRSSNIQVSLQAVSAGGSLQNLTTTNFPTLASSVYGTGVAFTAATGILDMQDAASVYGSGVRFSALPLGIYKIRLLNNTASSWLVLNAIDVITPIYSYKSNLYADLQNTLPVGSNSLMDSRKMSMVKEALPAQKAWAQATMITSGVNTASVAATTPVPLPDMSCTIKTNGSPLDVSYAVSYTNATTNRGGSFFIYVDGTKISTMQVDQANSNYHVASERRIIPVSAGVHKVDIYWGTDGLGTIYAKNRTLVVKEL
jgi:hypothetical protein